MNRVNQCYGKTGGWRLFGPVRDFSIKIENEWRLTVIASFRNIFHGEYSTNLFTEKY